MAFVVVGSLSLTLAAQSESNLRFEVASIKARTADDTTPFRVSFEPGGRFVTVNAPLTFWMGQVYPTQSGRIEGRPASFGTEGFDINAKAEGDPSREQMLEMLRSSLRERFKLAVHYEPREEDTFALVRNSPERLGPRLRPIDVDCAARAAAEKAGNAPPPLPPANGAAACRTLSISGSITSGGMTIPALARSLEFGVLRFESASGSILALARVNHVRRDDRR